MADDLMTEMIVSFLTQIGTQSLVDGDRVRDFCLDLLMVASPPIPSTEGAA